jgi:hypothetical protein
VAKLERQIRAAQRKRKKEAPVREYIPKRTRHVHSFGAEEDVPGEPGKKKRTCSECGFIDEYEEM